MNREEILEKSRNEKKDEGMIEAENKGRRIGITAFSAVFIFIILFNFINGQPSYAPMAMFWAFAAAEAYPKYKFTNKKDYLVTAIAGAVASIGFLACFVINVLR